MIKLYQLSDCNQLNEKIIRINKPDKLKISATLSAICNKLALIPTKVLTEMKDKTKNIKSRVFVKLMKVDKDFKVQVLEDTDALCLKRLLQNTEKDAETVINEYAKKTLDKDALNNLSTRVATLKGIVKSFNLK